MIIICLVFFECPIEWGEYLWNLSSKDKTFFGSQNFPLSTHLSAGPIAKPMQKATSPKAYTLPYTAEWRMSTRYPSSGIMHESTIPIANPKPALGKIRWYIDVADGICEWNEVQVDCTLLNIFDLQQSNKHLSQQAQSVPLSIFQCDARVVRKDLFQSDSWLTPAERWRLVPIVKHPCCPSSKSEATVQASRFPYWQRLLHLSQFDLLRYSFTSPTLIWVLTRRD